MAVIRHTDVLGGIHGGFAPFVPFAGWRTYSVEATYTDPDGFEFPAFRIRQTGGPVTDTISQHGARIGNLFVDRSWPYGNSDIQGSFPALAWYLLDPTTMVLEAGPLLPLGNASIARVTDRDNTPLTEHFIQWFDHTTPITGPFIALQVARQPSLEFPLYVAGHPVDIATELLTRKGELYDAASAAACRVAVGAELAHIAPITDTEQRPQDVIDTFSEAYGFAVRRGLTGSAEFVHWREKLGSIAALPVLDNDSIRAEGGPTFDLADSSRITRVRVTGQVISKWIQGTMTVVDRVLFDRAPFMARRPRVIYKTVLAPTNDKPASGLLITSAPVTFDYSTAPPVPDSDVYGEQPFDIELGGMPGFLGSNGEVYTTNLEQFAEGIARKTFDGHARGRVMGTAPGIRGTDFDDALLGEAVAVNIDHFPNAQLGQSPTSQRGGLRPYRVIERTEEVTGPICSLADEGTGVQYAITPTLVVWMDPSAIDILRVSVSDAAALAADGAQVEFQVRVFGFLSPAVTADPGVSYTVKDSTLWLDDPQMIRLGPFPPIHKVIIRARAWLYGGGASDWSLWYGLGGPITGPQTTLSNLVISNFTNVGADLDWSYDESPQVGTVKVQTRDITSGFIGPYVDYGSPLAAGTESLTLVGLTSGKIYEVRLVLIDGALVEYGDVLTGSFPTTGGLISGLGVSSVTASEAKLAWTNTDAARSVLIEIQADTDADFHAVIVLPPTSNRYRLTGLTPSTDYDVRVSLWIPLAPPSLLAGVSVGNGANGPALTASFTTLAVSVVLEFPLISSPFEAWDPQTAQRHDGRYGVRLQANPNNYHVVHDIIVLLATETAVGSGTPGAFVEQVPIAALAGIDLWFIADAPNDGKLRYMKALSRALGYTDSIETVEVSADPWPDTGPTPPVGGGIPNTHTLAATALASGAHSTGSFFLPDGAELFRVSSPLAKDIRIRLYTNSTVQSSDAARAPTSSLWPVGLLFDATVETADSHLIDIPPPQRVRVYPTTYENQVVWYTLTNLEAGTEDVSAMLFYFATSANPTLP